MDTSTVCTIIQSTSNHASDWLGYESSITQACGHITQVSLKHSNRSLTYTPHSMPPPPPPFLQKRISHTRDGGSDHEHLFVHWMEGDRIIVATFLCFKKHSKVCRVL